MFFKLSVLKNFAVFTWKHLCWSLFLIKLQTCRKTPSLILFVHERSNAYMRKYSKLINRKSNYRSSCPEVFCKKGVIRNFAKFPGKHLCQSLFFLTKLQTDTCNFIKKDTLAQVFSCEFCKIYKTTFL